MIDSKRVRWRYAAGLVSATGLLTLAGCASSYDKLNSDEQAMIDDHGHFVTEKKAEQLGGVGGYVYNEDLIGTRQKRADQAGIAAGAATAPVPAKTAFEPLTFYFDEGKATLKDADKQKLEQVVVALGATPDLMIGIDGYTDSKGSPELNKKLSKDRAMAVTNELASKGADLKQIMIRGHGEDLAKPSEKGVAGNAEDRKAVIAKLEKQPTTG